MRISAVRKLLGLFVLIGALALIMAPAALAAGTITVNNGVACVIGAQSDPYTAIYCTIEDAVADSSAGDTISVSAGTYIVPSNINFDDADVILAGAGSAATHVQVSGAGYRFSIVAPGVVIRDLDIEKTDKTGTQDIIWINASNVQIKNNKIHGQFVIGDGEVSRAIVVSAGHGGLLIEGNTIYALRQPAYVSGPTTGDVKYNFVYGTKGWVLENGDLTFTGNTWGTGAQVNVYDIAILSTVAPDFYTDIVAMSNANNGAVIEDQRVSPAVLSVVYVDAATSFSSDLGGRYHPYATISPAVTRVVAGGTILVAPGAYTENLNVNKALSLRGATGGDFSSPVVTGTAAAPGVWYTDRYAPAVFESYNFGGEMVLRHGVRAADLQGNDFYNTQGRKLDTNQTGLLQSMSIDVWLDASMGGSDQRYFGLWATGFDAVPAVSAYPIVAFRNVTGSPIGFYGWDYHGAGGWTLLKEATPADYGRWHTFTLELAVGVESRYFLDGQLAMTLADTDTLALNNVILNVKNFGQDYDVYWDNFKVGSAAPAPYEPVVTGAMNITGGNVEVTGLYLTNPSHTNAVVIANTASNVKIANNRVQGVGSTSLVSNVHALVMSNGADQVTITNNGFSNLKASGKSVSAIGVLDSTATNASEGLVIEANTFTDIASDTKGAYGVIINNKTGAPGAQIKNNVFGGMNGGWTHAIGLEGPTPNAVVTGNVFSGLTAAGADNIAVHFEDNPVAATVAVSGNQFNGGGYYGVAINPDDLPGGANGSSYIVTAENNWWGSACGPSAAGVSVGPNVDFAPWWLTAIGGGTSSGGTAITAGMTAAQQSAIINCAAPGATITYAAGTYPGGIIVTNNNITIDLGGATVGAGSPAFTILGDDVTLQNGILNGDGDDPGVLVADGADNFTLNAMEIESWLDGVVVTGSHASLKIVNNWFHDNDNGLQFNGDAALSGVITIEGNLFKSNTGPGIQNESAASVEAEYNSWGNVAGPGAGDGISTNVDADPWSFVEVFTDADARSVVENQVFTVNVKVEAAGLYAVQYKLTFDPKLLVLQGVSDGPFKGTGSCATDTATAGTISVYCTRFSPDADVNAATEIVSVLTFKADPNASHDGEDTWTATLDLSSAPADLYAGARDGIKVWVNNGGFGLPSVTARDITDTTDGTISIAGLAQFKGYIDLQGRTNDSGALLSVYDAASTTTSVLKATATSAASGAYVTAYVSGQQLSVGNTYYFQVDRDLYLPTTRTVATDVPAPTDWADFKLLSDRPDTVLGTVVLLGGDATNDNAVDVLDAGAIGGAYGTVVPCGAGACTDVTGDGKVDILDLTLMGGNYNKTSSPWVE